MPFDHTRDRITVFPPRNRAVVRLLLKVPDDAFSTIGPGREERIWSLLRPAVTVPAVRLRESHARYPAWVRA